MAETFFESVFLNIPSPIITDILSRLPPKAAIRCRCVCKPWLKLLSEAEFVNLHLSKSPPHLIVLNLSATPPDSPYFNLVQVEDETDHHGVRRIAEMDSEIRWSRSSIGRNMIDSINGLLCIVEFSFQYELIHVWNPIMGEYITVEPFGGLGQSPNIATSYGFGISSGKYRLVMILEEIEIINRHVRDSTCHVYTIGAGSWKSIGPAPHLHISRRPEHGLFLNGNIHWLINDDDHPEQICCLNLDTELFQPFPPLPKLGVRVLATLNLYKGCLSVCDNTPCYDIVIWVMIEYGLQNSWSKEVVISKDPVGLVGGNFEGVYIIKVFKDGELLLLWGDTKLFSYHPQRKTAQVIDVGETMTGPYNRFIPCIKVNEYVPSIVSLKNLGEVNVNRS